MIVSPPLLSRADAAALFHQVVEMTTGGGETSVTIRSTWATSVQWARNRPTISGETTTYSLSIMRALAEASVSTELSQLDRATLQMAVQMLDQRLRLQAPDPNDPAPAMLGPQTYLTPPIWSDATSRVTAAELADTARHSVVPVADAKLIAAGYLEVGVASWAIFNTRGLDAYAAATGALYTESVRMADDTGAGWAAKRHTEWSKLDTSALSVLAIQKCLASANPVAIEPGRYTAILEPIVTAVLFACAVQAMDREAAESWQTVYTATAGKSKIGQPIMDARLTVGTDPMDPDCGYIPFDPEGWPYRQVTWVKNGILTTLPYDRAYARQHLRTDTALPNPMAFRVSGGNTPIEEMIATTERGVLVSRLGLVTVNDPQQLAVSAVTQDGLFLIEQGKITHPLVNMWISESPLRVFNRVVQIGPSVPTVGTFLRGVNGDTLRDLPARALTDGYAPVVAPAIKVEDFTFTRLSNAI